METKQIPLVVMLLAGAASSITTKLMHYELETSLWILLIVLIVFYAAGCALKRTIDTFEAANQKLAEEEAEVSEAGEVIEKEAIEKEASENDDRADRVKEATDA